MKNIKTYILLQLLALASCFTSCTRSSGEVWEDTKSCSRHIGRGFGSLGGKQGDSRQIQNPDDFSSFDDSMEKGEVMFDANEFIPLQDEQGNEMVYMQDSRPPRMSPGDPGSSIPGVEAFRDPRSDPQLAPVFKNISFEYNSNLVKGEQNLQIVQNIAGYMRSHPHLYIFVEGHCCEKGPVAYNLALGSRRANAVRDLLIQQGVSPDNVFTISYGKERPLVYGEDDAALTQNRRAQFKVFER